MGWVRLDDGLADHPKTLRAWARDPAAMGLLLRAWSWCGKHESDGVVPQELIASWLPAKATRDRITAILIDVGFLELAEGGDFQIHDYLDLNPSRKDKDDDREAARKRMAEARARKKGGDGS